MLLDEIVKHKKSEVEKAKIALPPGVLIKNLAGIEPLRGFKESLSSKKAIGIIAEIKHSSPVKGLLRMDFDPEKLSIDYESGGAAAISVLTDERFFKGHKDYISLIKKVSRLPVLRKDFIIEDYQIIESRTCGADAILLIASILDDCTLKRLLELTVSLGMDALVEVHDRTELSRAVAVGAYMIGINNRNLQTFQVNLTTTLDLLNDVPEGVLLISESGISSRDDILMLEAAGVEAVLIGETLMRAHDPCAKLKELLGHTKAKEA